jgi:hypothetical protein
MPSAEPHDAVPHDAERGDDATSGTARTDVAEGMEHLQSAARELIQAARSLLDAAEDLVEDPGAVQGIVGTLTSLAGAAANRLRTTSSAGDTDPDGDGRVKPIKLS